MGFPSPPTLWMPYSVSIPQTFSMATARPYLFAVWENPGEGPGRAQRYWPVPTRSMARPPTSLSLSAMRVRT